MVRETIKKFLRVRRAHEEIDRCNIEVRRLFTSICDEDHRFDVILKCLTGRNDVILGAVGEYCARRRRVNALLLERIRCTFALDGFTGNKTVGSRKGDRSLCMGGLGIPAGCDYTIGSGVSHDLRDGEGLEGGDGEDIDDVDTDQIDGLITFVTSL